ncbi:MAG: ThuA domain-containing protein, partial [Planctomycetes bacterium]|nr:ThuA domain-containing protein [Planctomycetota bacterium]
MNLDRIFIAIVVLAAPAGVATVVLAQEPDVLFASAAEIPGGDGISAEERLKIEHALPDKAPAAPARPRKLLIFDRNVGYAGHRSIPYANLAFTRMGSKTGAFQAAVETDPAAFEAENLKQYDAVFFNNTVG